MAKKLSARKAKTILSDGEIGGKPLTDKQIALFRFIAGGGKPTRLRR